MRLKKDNQWKDHWYHGSIQALFSGFALFRSLAMRAFFTRPWQVGEGTFGDVFKAKHLETGRVVALKKIRIRRLEARFAHGSALDPCAHPRACLFSLRRTESP